jgi:hypothetical protein
MKVSFIADRLAKAKGENDSENLNSEDRHRHDDHDVQVRDDPVVHRLVATLKQKSPNESYEIIYVKYNCS